MFQTEPTEKFQNSFEPWYLLNKKLIFDYNELIKYIAFLIKFSLSSNYYFYQRVTLLNDQ